jgi:hypothetical protein
MNTRDDSQYFINKPVKIKQVILLPGILDKAGTTNEKINKFFDTFVYWVYTGIGLFRTRRAHPRISCKL